MTDSPPTPTVTTVVTTIQSPTACMKALERRLAECDGALLIVGDRKGPPCYPLERATLLGLDEQADTAPELAALLPENHYARKNVGYLAAIERRAPIIYETDDDNAPNATWAPREEMLAREGLVAPLDDRDDDRVRWLNVFRLFTAEPIWPRGFPLDRIADAPPEAAPLAAGEPIQAPIQQGLVDDVPDVDAVWRLVMNRTFRFDPGPSVIVPRGIWCPFNTQSTWWWPSAYPLMYLPSFCSFRMTDIWRSFVAQRCLWEFADGMVFHAPEVEQERNPHDLMRDFADEIPGYTRNHELACTLAELDLAAGAAAAGDNLVRCYEALVAAQFFPTEELALVAAWVEAVSARLSPTP